MYIFEQQYLSDIEKNKFSILNLKNVEIINSRVEDYSRENREKFDIVTCRAVTSIPIILELSTSLVKVNGYLSPLKSNCEEELSKYKYLLKDLIKELDTSIIIVADGGLGTINSILLTVAYAHNNGINIKGIILNNYEPSNFMHQDNLKQVEYLTGVKVVATVEKGQKDIKLLENLFEV